MNASSLRKENRPPTPPLGVIVNKEVQRDKAQLSGFDDDFKAAVNTCLAAIGLMSDQMRLDMARQAVQNQSMPWLIALDRVGFFNVSYSNDSNLGKVNIESESTGLDDGSPSPMARRNDRYVFQEMPRLACLADITQGIETARGVSLKFCNTDPNTDESWTSQGVLSLCKVDASESFRVFFRRRIQHFSNIRDPATEFRQSMTAAQLMCAACLLGEMDAFKLLVQNFPGAIHVFVHPRISDKAPVKMGAYMERITPMAVAMACGSLEAMALLEASAKCASKDIFKNVVDHRAAHLEASGLFDAAEPDVCRPVASSALNWVISQAKIRKRSVAPSVLEILLAREEKNFPCGLGRTPLQPLLSEIANVQALTPMLCVLVRSSLVSAKDLTDMAVLACHCGNYTVLESVLEKIDWSLFGNGNDNDKDNDNHMACFLPTLFAQKSADNFQSNASHAKVVNKWGFTDPQKEDMVMKLCRACIKAGRSDLLVDGPGSSFPLRLFTCLGMPRAMLLCLELGADPLACPPISPARAPSKDLIIFTLGMHSAKHYAAFFPACDLVLRSFLLRRAAHLALQSIFPVAA